MTTAGLRAPAEPLAPPPPMTSSSRGVSLAAVLSLALASCGTTPAPADAGPGPTPRLAPLDAADAAPPPGTPRAGYYRYPAIHGDTIVFTAEGDLWQVGRQGGVARRLTSGAGAEVLASISPDGSTVAFSASYGGPPLDVYTMPIGGSACPGAGRGVAGAWGPIRGGTRSRAGRRTGGSSSGPRATPPSRTACWWRTTPTAATRSCRSPRRRRAPIRRTARLCSSRGSGSSRATPSDTRAAPPRTCGGTRPAPRPSRSRRTGRGRRATRWSGTGGSTSSRIATA